MGNSTLVMKLSLALAVIFGLLGQSFQITGLSDRLEQCESGAPITPQ